MANVGNAIRSTRQGAGLTLRNLADRAGCSYAYLSQVERGERVPSSRWLRDIEQTLADYMHERREAS